MHSFNNSIAYGAQADGWEVSAVLGPLMLLACVLAAADLGPRARAAALDTGAIPAARSCHSFRGE